MKINVENEKRAEFILLCLVSVCSSFTVSSLCHACVCFLYVPLLPALLCGHLSCISLLRAVRPWDTGGTPGMQRVLCTWACSEAELAELETSQHQPGMLAASAQNVASCVMSHQSLELGVLFLGHRSSQPCVTWFCCS